MPNWGSQESIADWELRWPKWWKNSCGFQTLWGTHRILITSGPLVARPSIPSATATCWASSRTRLMPRRPSIPGTRNTSRPVVVAPLRADSVSPRSFPNTICISDLNLLAPRWHVLCTFMYYIYIYTVDGCEILQYQKDGFSSKLLRRWPSTNWCRISQPSTSFARPERTWRRTWRTGPSSRKRSWPRTGTEITMHWGK